LELTENNWRCRTAGAKVLTLDAKSAGVVLAQRVPGPLPQCENAIDVAALWS
jgi:hypothetical protein